MENVTDIKMGNSTISDKASATSDDKQEVNDTNIADNDGKMSYKPIVRVETKKVGVVIQQPPPRQHVAEQYFQWSRMVKNKEVKKTLKLVRIKKERKDKDQNTTIF